MTRLQEILTDALKLRDPEFRLHSHGGRVSGSVVSASFRGKPDHKRQQMIWDALDDRLGDEAPRHVGMLLAYMPEERNLDSAVISRS